MMEENVSRRGKRVRRIVGAMNHLPGISSGAIRTFLSEHEKDWVCPPEYTNERLPLSHCYMELLKPVSDPESDMGAEESELEKTVPENSENDEKGVVYQLHGGGYAGMLQNAYRNMAHLYSEMTGYDVVSLDYRVAPENPYPAAILDAEEGFKWILEKGYEKIILVGDSAGGGLALSLTLYLKDNGIRLPDKIVTMSAWTDLTVSGESYQKNWDIDPVFGKTDDIVTYKDAYVGDADPMSPYISPIFGDFTGFPDTLMQVGELEMLLSDTLIVAEKMQQAGVNVKEHTYMGMFHDFQKGFNIFEESKEAWDEIEEFING